MYCRMPHNSMIIHPDGKLAVCCSNEKTFHYGHISETKDLANIWNTSYKMNALRNDDTEYVTKACNNCLKYKGIYDRWSDVNTNGWFTSVPIDKKIRFLEFTTSNICNQTCVTCSSYFSSKWKSLEEEAIEMNLPINEWKNGEDFNSFGSPIHRLTDSDIEKILKLLPDLHTIYVKGGEPFADSNNFIILKELKRVNPECIVRFTTNVSKIPHKFLEVLTGLKVFFACSIDGVEETYDYIRSSKFEETIENIKRLSSISTSFNISVSCVMSVYNIFNIKDYCKWWSNNLIKEVKGIKIHSWIGSPYFVSALHLMSEDQIKSCLDDLKQYLTNINYKNRVNIGTVVYNAKLLKTISEEERQNLISKFHKYTKFMNYKRGINIYDVHPQLLLL